MTHPTEPHERAAAGLDESKWLSDEEVKREIYKPKFKTTYLVGVLLGLAAFVGIVIGMM